MPFDVTDGFLIACAVAALFFVLFVRAVWRARSQRRRFHQIVSVDEEVSRLRREIDALIAKKQAAEEDARRAAKDLRAREAALGADYEAAQKANQARLATLERDYVQAKATHDELVAAVKALEEDLAYIDVGVYQPHFSFDDTAAYKQAVEKCREDLKAAIKADTAVVWGAAWTVEGSSAKGERMQRQYGNALLRAFNGECEAAIANVAWNNVTKMEARIEKAFSAINKLGTVMKVELNSHYLGLRLQELRLVHEHASKKQAEAEEQRRIREQMREEERVQRELERAKQEAEADERRYQRALDRAREEATRATGKEMTELGERIRELEQSLAEAHARGERAISQAELTKCGHVYVISNIGSFGDDVFKIGMTRRLEPLDRIRELGDASVPFAFDVHAMIYSEDAPALETALHRRFSDARVNLINERKEFFRTDLTAIADFAASLGLKAELTLVAEAREYRETNARRSSNPADRSASFPATLS